MLYFYLVIVLLDKLYFQDLFYLQNQVFEQKVDWQDLNLDRLVCIDLENWRIGNRITWEGKREKRENGSRNGIKKREN